MRPQYDPWGLALPLTEQNANLAGSPEHRWQYNGKEKVPDLGWYEYGFRWYAPDRARFLQTDPMAEKMPFISSYSYTFNNSLKYIDEEGLLPKLPSWGVFVKTLYYDTYMFEALWTANNTSLVELEKHSTKWNRALFLSLIGQSGQVTAERYMYNSILRQAESQSITNGSSIVARTYSSRQNPDDLIDFTITLESTNVKHIGIFDGKDYETDVNYNLIFNNLDGSTYKISLTNESKVKINFEVKTTGYEKATHVEGRSRNIVRGVTQTIRNIQNHPNDYNALILSTEFWAHYQTDPIATQQINRLQAAGGHLLLVPGLSKDAAKRLENLVKKVQ